MAKNPHIIVIPFPIQGHINPMIQFCNRLISKGVRVTLVTTSSTIKSLKKQSSAHPINIEVVPECTIDEEVELDAYDITIRKFRAAITNGLNGILEKHKNSGYPVKAIVYDSVIPWILEMAHQKGLKGAVFFTQSCTVTSVYHHLHKGSLENSGSEVKLPSLPVMELKDLPSLVYDMNSYPSLLRLAMEQFFTLGKADWQLFNTFDKLEEEIIKWMRNKYRIQAIGPTIPSMYIDKRLPENYDYGFSLFKPNTDSCLKWLDKQEDHSTIYVSFGSLANLVQKQMEELAWGLIDSKCNFLWVVRDTEYSKLPQEFVSQLPDKGLIVNWCRQLEVLSHPAVGCFITHGGWNSTLEALTLGVPMVVVPQWTDQPTNAKMIAHVWKTGVRVRVGEDEIVTREEVAARVNDVMDRERGREMRENAVKWKDLAVEAVSEGGSSDRNITELARELLSA